MPNPAFLVEGQMEQRILGKICLGQPIRRINCNGDHVLISKLCDFVETQIRLLGNRYYPIIVIFDREARIEEPNFISNRMTELLADRGLGDQDIRIFVADRETEDWYLKDIDSICEHFGVAKLNATYQGKGGLARLIRPAEEYHETTTGVEIFDIVSKEKIAQECEVFRRLMQTAEEIKCINLQDLLI